MTFLKLCGHTHGRHLLKRWGSGGGAELGLKLDLKSWRRSTVRCGLSAASEDGPLAAKASTAKEARGRH
jgi:hypothetical protein